MCLPLQLCFLRASNEIMVASAGSGDKKDVKFGIVDDNCDGFDVEICPDLLVAGLAAFGAAAFAALYTAITMKGRKRRRRSALYDPKSSWDSFQDLFHIGIFPN